MATIRQQEMKKIIVGNLGKSLRDAMIKSGYSVNYADNPQQFAMTRAGKEIGEWIEFEISKVQEEMNSKRNKANYKDLADTLMNLKKLNQLLIGKPTEIQETQIEDELKAIFNEAMNKQKKNDGGNNTETAGTI